MRVYKMYENVWLEDEEIIKRDREHLDLIDETKKYLFKEK